MGRKSLKEVRKQEIVKVYYKMARRAGYEQVSIAKLAETMEVNPSLIIHYFETKEALKDALIDFILDRYLLIYAIPDQKKTSLQTLVALIDRLFSKKWNQLFDDGLFYAFYAEAFRNNRIKRKYKTILDALRSHLTAIIESCVQQELLQVESPAQLADQLFILLDGAYFYLSLEESKTAFEQRIQFYKKQAYHILAIDPLLYT